MKLTPAQRAEARKKMWLKRQINIPLVANPDVANAENLFSRQHLNIRSVINSELEASALVFVGAV